MLAIVAHENMKLGDNTLNNKRLSLLNAKFLTKYLRIVALILLPYNISITLKLKGHIGVPQACKLNSMCYWTVFCRTELQYNVSSHR